MLDQCSCYEYVYAPGLGSKEQRGMDTHIGKHNPKYIQPEISIASSKRSNMKSLSCKASEHYIEASRL